MAETKGEAPAVVPPATPTATIPVEVLNAPDAARFGRYVCTRRLGGGGDGDVWKAWDQELARWVALKFLKGGDPEEVARFEREARTAAQLSHPGIATVFEVGQMNGRFYLTMLYVDGRTLHQFPRQDRKLIVSFVRDAARALAFAHQRGVVHRDVKPQNILIAGRSMADSTWVGGRTDHPHRVYLTDFGLARSTQGLPEAPTPGTVMGTPVYMSPEQSRGQTLDATTDVWSLGITLYELLGDRVPFKGSDVADTLKKVQVEEPAPLRSLNSWVDGDLQTIVHKCLEKTRARRYPDAGALADDLDRWIRKEPIQARPANLAYRFSKMIARRRTTVLVVAGAVAVVVTAFAVIRPDLGGKGGPASLSESQRAMVQQMRTTAEVCIDAALDLRRAGMPSASAKYADRLKTACAQVIEAAPGLAEPHVLLGRMQRAQMKTREALAEQSRALAKEPDCVPAAYERAVLATRAHRAWLMESMDRVFRQSVEAAAQARPAPRDLASEFITRMRALSQGDAAARTLTPDLLRDLDVLERKLPALAPAAAACVRGFRAWTRNDPSEAFRQFEGALRLQPATEEACEELACLCCVALRFEEAERWYSQGIDQDRGYLPFHLGRARARLMQARLSPLPSARAASLLEGAAADLTTAIAASSAAAEPWILRGEVRALRGSIQQARGEDPLAAWTGAVTDLDDAVRRDPKSSEALLARAGVHLDLAERPAAKPEEAAAHVESVIRDASALIKDDALCAPAWDLRGRARARLAEQDGSETGFAAAVEDLRKVGDLLPSADAAWTRLGSTFGAWAAADLKAGRDPRPHAEDALAALDRAVELNASRPESLLHRAKARQLRTLSPGIDPGQAQGDLKAAMDDLRAAEKLDLSRSPALAAMAEELRRALHGRDY